MANSKSKHLIVGFGEVGKSLYELIDEAGFEVEALDIDDRIAEKKFHVLHVCFPYSESFVRDVKQYQSMDLVDGGLTIIHATVPVGTTEQIPGAVHSPVRGVHPNLKKGLQTFVKYVGGPRCLEASEVLQDIGIKFTMATDSSKTTEAIKLWDTTYYGWNIIFEKQVKAYCDKHGLDFDLVYEHANQTYNQGYSALGNWRVIRPILKDMPGKIGGHCVVQNCDLLDDDIAGFLKQFDSKL